MTPLSSLRWLCVACAASIVAGSDGGLPDRGMADGPVIGGNIFAGTNVLRIRIQIPPSGIRALRNAGGGNGRTRPKAKAMVREGGNTFTNVEIQLKGAAGSFRSIDQNPCLTLNFDNSAAGQRFHGLHKISLNNSVQDPSYLSEKICRELFEAAGVPVPRAAYAKVELNGADLGLYVLTEGFNKQFLKRYFKNTKGNLYDGGFVKDITQPLTINSGNRQDHSGLRALIATASNPNATNRFAQLEGALDMDRFLSFIAMEVLQCHWDGYAMNRNNWRVFHDLDSNKMVFFPHGLDQMFGVERTSPECSVLPPMQGLVARAVTGTPEGKRQYLARMSQIYTNVFHVDAVLKRIDELAAVIRPVIEETDNQAARYHGQEVQRLKQRIVRRDQSLKRQLMLATDGVVPLRGWKQTVQNGTPSFYDRQGKPGNPELYISASDENATGSWRTRVSLERGNYVFEGKIRTRDVKPGSGERRGGAGLRVSRGIIPQEWTGSNEWRKFAYPFQLPERSLVVEFVCELRESKGEVWFDAASLQVVRLP